MPNTPVEIQLDRLMQWRVEADKHILELKADAENYRETTDEAIEALKNERTKALWWGVSVLGTSVLAMGAFIAKMTGVIAKLWTEGHIK